MELNVLERLLALNLLPKEGTFANLKLLRVTRENLSFSEEENKSLNFRNEGTGNEARTLWNDGLPDKDVQIGEVATQMLVKALKKLNDEEKLTPEHMTLYEKFVE